jgi:hypothetical protein
MKNLFLILFFFTSNVFANITEAPMLSLLMEQNPPNVKFKKIESAHFKILFASELESEAKRVLNKLEQSYEKVSASLSAQPAKLSLVLHNRSADANGFVSFAPRRSEWFTRPWFGPELSCSEWLNTLAIHEFRHVAQFAKTHQGFAKFLYIILGETGLALANGLSIPAWFFEGDAVGIETALTNCGRGRVAQFDRDLRAIIETNQSLTYDQSLLGSYKVYAPNHYVYGYLLTTYLRRNYGKDILKNLQNYALEHGWNLLSFLRAIEKYTNKKFEDVFVDALTDYKNEWNKKLKDRSIVEGEQVFPDTHDWVNYYYSSPVEGRVLSFKKSFSNISQFVLTEKDNEDVLFTPTQFLQELPLKIKADKIIIPELQIDPRFLMKSFVKLQIFDLKNKKVVWTKNKTRFFMPVLNHDATMFAAISWKKNGSTSIVVYNINQEKITQDIKLPQNELLQHLSFIDADSLAVISKNYEGLKTLWQLKLSTHEFSAIKGPILENFSYPDVLQDWIYYQSDLSGIDEIYRININSKKQEKLTASRFGSYYPLVYGNELWFSNYHSTGMKPHKLKINNLTNLLDEDLHIEYFKPLIEQENSFGLTESFEKLDPKATSHSTNHDLWTPHSWLLLAPPLGTEITAQIISQDVLSMHQFRAGTKYSLNEKAIQGFTSFQYSKYYPILGIGAGYGGRSQIKELPNGKEIHDRWEEGVLETYASLPYLKLWREFVFSVNFRQALKLTNIQGYEVTKTGEFSNLNMASTESQLIVNFTKRQAKRDILSPLGFSTNFYYESGKELRNGKDAAFLQGGSLRYFLPSFFKHHHLYGEWSAESQKEAPYFLPSKVLFPRGHVVARHVDSFQKQSVNYLFSFWYPDYNLKRYIYFNRLMLNTFYDHLYSDEGPFRRFESAGGELLLETHFLSNSFPLTWGIRRAEKLGEKSKGEWSVFLFTNIASY